MDHTYVDEKSLKSLEDYAVFLTSGIITLITLQNLQVQAIKIGIMPEDLNERANTIVWDIRRQMNHYQVQLNAVLDLLPEDFTAATAIQKLQDKEKTKARSMLRQLKNKIDGE